MSERNRPRSRKRNISGQGNGVHRRTSQGGKSPLRSTGTLSLPVIIIMVIVYFLSGGSSSSNQSTQNYTTYHSSDTVSTAVLDTTVADGTRAKYTNILGDGNDVNTIMVYMCGADLESKNGMATSDIVEMTKSTYSENVNIIILTGGASKWQNNVVSSSYNQIYQVINGQLKKIGRKQW